jgi:hypothetical protein
MHTQQATKHVCETPQRDQIVHLNIEDELYVTPANTAFPLGQ